ncbi:hypothetical protein HH212_26280 [Massilia forsythiae]|uniref:Uncharacterized protein n=1 Tax=Massilia forsythiae TaxID=2728020 RepID=A0A7Z2W1A0_9BURK|nr:hypothetical protein [Massilia forsythiae]QJE03066.1 hypothetical protein HH212_26280 [Massilia forsythiae]
MRIPPLLNVEVDGITVRRPAELDVLVRDLTGRPTVSRVRPQLLPGELLQERLGRIPAIIKEVA